MLFYSKYCYLRDMNSPLQQIGNVPVLLAIIFESITMSLDKFVILR